jgi:hypothetical protein
MAMGVTKNAQGSGIEQQRLRLPDGQPNPAGSKDAAKMAMGEERDVTVECAQAEDKSIGTGADLVGCFSIRRTVPEEAPTRSRGENLRSGAALVIPIVPLRKIGLDFGCPVQCCQSTGLLRPLQRTGQYMGKRDPAKAPADVTGFILTPRGQSDVRAAGVSAGERPLGFTVPDEIEAQRFNPARVPFSLRLGVIELPAGLSVFELRHFRQTAPMALGTAETGEEKCFNQLPGKSMPNDKTTEADQIDVIVLDSLVGRKRVMNQTGSDARHLVGNNRSTDSAAADGNTSLHISSGDCSGQRHDKIRIIVIGHRLPVTEINDFRTGLTQHADQVFFELITAVIGSYADTFRLPGRVQKVLR